MVWSNGGDAGLAIAVLGAGAFLTYIISHVRESSGSAWLIGGLLSVFTCAAAACTLLVPQTSWGYLEFDGLGRYLTAVALALCTVVSLYSIRYMRESDGAGRYYGLTLTMIAGAVGVVSARDSVGLYLYFELMSISSYSLVSFRKDMSSPVEAGLKYIFMNAMGSGLTLMGIALTYLYRGTTALGAVGWVLAPGESALLGPGWLALVLTVSGLGVKTAMVPFHTWAPEAYSEAPAGVSALLGGLVSKMGLIAMIRLVLGEFSQSSQPFGIMLIFMALITMLVGNLGALGQRDIKKMLAYSSVAQVGFILAGFGLGFGLGIQDGIKGSLFHLLTHSLMKAGAFIGAGILIDELGTRDIRKMRGAGHKYALVAAVVSLACLSLAGIPGLAGFMSKWWIYRAGLESATQLGRLVSVWALVNSVLSLGYYLPVVFALFAKPQQEENGESDAFETPVSGTVPRQPSGAGLPWEIAPLALLGLGILALGLYPLPAIVRAIEVAASVTWSCLGGLQ